jgi:hypothetical protein
MTLCHIKIKTNFKYMTKVVNLNFGIEIEY